MPTPLDPNRSLAFQTQKQPTFDVPFSLPLLGFKQVVAPINTIARAKKPRVPYTPLPRDVYSLSGVPHATTQVAPNLYNLVREILEARKMSTSSIQDYLASIKSWNRYQNAFQHFLDLLPDSKKEN